MICQSYHLDLPFAQPLHLPFTQRMHFGDTNNDLLSIESALRSFSHVEVLNFHPFKSTGMLIIFNGFHPLKSLFLGAIQ